MNTSLLRIVKWFCRKVTFNELSSAVVIFLEVLNGSRKDIHLKPNEKPPHYRQFRIDTLPPLTAKRKDISIRPDQWRMRISEIEQETGKPIKPITEPVIIIFPLMDSQVLICMAKRQVL